MFAMLLELLYNKEKIKKGKLGTPKKIPLIMAAVNIFINLDHF
jgi:hypothetical protein